MVLDNAINDASPFASNDQPPDSDADTFSNASDALYMPASPMELDASRLGGYVPGTGPIFPDFTRKWQEIQLRRIFDPTNQQVEKFAGRHMRQPEWQAIAEHYISAVQIGAFSKWAGLTLSMAYYVKGHATYRLPLYQPNMEAFNRTNKFGLFKGNFAKGILHGIRFTSYWGLGWFGGLAVGRWVGGSYALSLCLQDSRLQELVKEYRNGFQKEQSRRPTPGARTDRAGGQRRQADDQSTLQDGSSGVYDAPLARVDNGSIMSGSYKRQGDDDMSPTGESFYDTYAGGDSRGSRAGPSYNQNDLGRHDAPRGTSDRSNSGPSSTFTAEPSYNQDSSPQDSPESSWDRIRRQASNTSTNVDSSTRSNNGGYSFSNRDEDGQLAKTEAQRDFDARVERERRGQDFDSDGRGRKW